jgi:hypothetical protein
LQIYTLAANGVSGKQLGSKVACVQQESGASLQQKMQKKNPTANCVAGKVRLDFYFFKNLTFSFFFKKKIKKVLCVSLHHFFNSMFKG